MRRYVVGYLLSHDLRRVLLIWKSRPAVQAGKLNGIGGKMEPEDSDDYEATMRREFREETGMDVTGWKQFGMMEGVGAEPWYCALFWAIGDPFKFRQTTEEQPVVCDVREVLLGELRTLTNVPADLALALQSIADPKRYIMATMQCAVDQGR